MALLTSLGSKWSYSDVVQPVGLFQTSALQPDVFPEMGILWLLTRAWNTGILLYSLAQYPEAERWCGLAMSFVRHLGILQESYERQVQQWTRGIKVLHKNYIFSGFEEPLFVSLSVCACRCLFFMVKS